MKWYVRGLENKDMKSLLSILFPIEPLGDANFDMVYIDRSLTNPSFQKS